MKVLETNANFGVKAYVQDMENAPPPEMEKERQLESNKEVPEDKVSLSKSATDMQVAKDSIAAAPEVRTEKVQELKESVDSGAYEVNAQKIADKMIGSKIDELI